MLCDLLLIQKALLAHPLKRRHSNFITSIVREKIRTGRAPQKVKAWDAKPAVLDSAGIPVYIHTHK